MHGSSTAHTPASAPRRPGPTPPQLLAHADITLLEIGPALSAMEIQAHEGAYSPAIVGLLATLHELVAHMTEFREELRFALARAEVSVRQGRPSFSVRACD
jgi:hypothetical protein